MFIKKIFVCFVAFLAFPLGVFAATFSDVSNDHPQYAAIESLQNLGVINGYGDGTFGPENPVNRVEALKMILKSAEVELVEADSSEIYFSDVFPDAWYMQYIITGKERGIVNGNPDGTFAPARAVNKAEFLKMMLESFEIDLSKHQDVSGGLSADTYEGQWFLPYFSYATILGIVTPTLDNMLYPDKSLSRAECAEIIYRMLVILKGGDAQKLLSIAESNLVYVIIKLNNDNVFGAIENANTAVFYTEQVLLMEPDDSVAQGAQKIAKGFQSLCFAYQAGAEGRFDDLESYVAEAKSYADGALVDDISFLSLKAKIYEIGDIFLEQI